jgi:hypothetical protein
MGSEWRWYEKRGKFNIWQRIVEGEGEFALTHVSNVTQYGNLPSPPSGDHTTTYPTLNAARDEAGKRSCE